MDSVSDDAEATLQSIFDASIMDKISEEDMKVLLQRILSKPSNSNIKRELNKALLVYPPSGTDRVTINPDDYVCLTTDQYLNDIIISFYLKYILNEFLTEEQRQKTHVFSTFFYNRLTKHERSTQDKSDKAVKLTPAQKRHDRVKNWTKNVNLFEKDFIIIPICDQQHWYLAIICFPALKGPVTMDGDIPVKPLALTKKNKLSLQIGSTTITPVSKRKVETSICLDEESERDEAEAEESELESEDTDNEVQEPAPSVEPIKQ